MSTYSLAIPNTHKAIEKLQTKGLKKEQAEGIVDMINEIPVVKRDEIETLFDRFELILERQTANYIRSTTTIVVGSVGIGVALLAIFIQLSL